jgi:hypothetical protein
LGLEIVAEDLLARGVFLGEALGAGGGGIDISDRRCGRKVLDDIRGTDNLSKTRIQDPVIP